MRQTTIDAFIRIVTDYYHRNGRTMPWRSNTSPYSVFVSEIMLQQTQVRRVLTKYAEFMVQFPNFQSLSEAKLINILRIWQGMGYNRRAKYLHESAHIVCTSYQGILPQEPHILETLPGIGSATAGSISCFAFDTPTIFVETNIRRCILHHFFPRRSDIPDTKVKDVLEQCMQTVINDTTLSPRHWYWALMDYGSYLKSVVANPNKRSRHYGKQSKFEGSNRQIRGRLLRTYLQKQKVPLRSLKEKQIWLGLVAEGLVDSHTRI